MELEIIRAVQSISNPVLDVLFQGLTMLGEPAFLIVLFTAVYWAGDKREGEGLAYAMLLSLLCNGIIKNTVRADRPIGQPDIRTLREKTAPGFSFPSAHTQGAATFYPSLAKRARRGWAMLLWLLPLAVGLSRVYLGVHYPRDVAAGLALGYGTAFFARRLLQKVRRRVLLYGTTLLLFIPAPLLIKVDHEFYVILGCMAGFAAAMLFEARLVRFSVGGPMRLRLLRWGVGLLLVGACAALLKALLPEGHGFTMLRYGLLIFLGAAGWPWVFTRLKW